MGRLPCLLTVTLLETSLYSSFVLCYVRFYLLTHVNVDEDDLRERAAKYGLEDEIDALLRYLETHGEVDDDRLPKWDEFQEFAADYEGQLS